MVVLRLLGGCLTAAALVACSAKEVSVVQPDLLGPCEVPGSEDDDRIKARCGSVRVPEDPSDPAGRQIDLGVLGNASSALISPRRGAVLSEGLSGGRL